MRVVILLALMMSVEVWAKRSDPAEKDVNTEAKSVERQACVDGTCYSTDHNQRLTDDRVYDRKLSERLMKTADKSQPPPVDSTKATKEQGK